MNICKRSVPFQLGRDIPTLNGKVVLVTGGNIGLGKQCVLEYARHQPAQIWLAARNPEKAQSAVDEIQAQLPHPAPIRILKMDLSSLESVKEAAATVCAESNRLDILMLNAGIMASAPDLTSDGYELQFGINYLGHALLAKLLLPLLQNATDADHADVRIIMVASHGHVYAPKPEGIRFDSLKTKGEDLGAFGRYSQSKLAMVLWARHMARLYPRFTVASVDPGVVRTNLIHSTGGSSWLVQLLLKVLNKVVTPVDEGVKNQIWASVGQEVKSGEYYEPVGIEGAGSQLGRDDNLARRLWEWTESELDQHVI